MVQNQSDPLYFTEMFDVAVEVIPQLYAYSVKLRGKDKADRIGRKLSYQLQRNFKGHWVWVENVLVSDIEKTSEDLKLVLQDIKTKDGETFKDVAALDPVSQWTITPLIQAEFVAQGLFGDIGFDIRRALQPPVDLNGRATVERQCDVRGWVVKDKPVVSISIDSRVVYNEDVKTYMRRLDSPQKLKGLEVATKVPFNNGKIMKGEITEIEGRLDVEIDRAELIKEASLEGNQEIIKNADKGEYVVRVKGYRYVVSALSIIVKTKDYQRLGIDSRLAQAAVWLTPQQRDDLVKKVTHTVDQSKKLIGIHLSSDTKSLFYPPSKFRYTGLIRLGSKTGKPGILAYQPDSVIFNAIKTNGFFSLSSQVGSPSQPLFMACLSIGNFSTQTAHDALLTKLKELGFPNVKIQNITAKDASRIELERALRQLENTPHTIVGFIPDTDSTDEEDWGPYLEFKALMMERGLSSQVIDQNTLKNPKTLPYVMQNVAMGLTAKLGHVPYVLDNEIEYADFVIGLDIARHTKKNGQGTLNTPAVTQVYQKDGRFVRSYVLEAPIEGETIPAKILRSLFPLDVYENKKVVVHRDGPFRGHEIQTIDKHLKEMGGEAFFVEVRKSGAPRLYSVLNKKTSAAELGTTFLLSGTEAFLVTSRSTTATPQP